MTRLTSLSPFSLITFTHHSISLLTLLVISITLNLTLSFITFLGIPTALNHIWSHKAQYAITVIKFSLTSLLKLSTLTLSLIWSYRSYYKRLGLYTLSCIIFCLLQIPIAIARLYRHCIAKEVVIPSPSKKKVIRSVSKAPMKESLNSASYGIITGCSFIEARRVLERKFDVNHLWLIRQSSYDDKVRVVSSQFEKKNDLLCYSEIAIMIRWISIISYLLYDPQGRYLFVPLTKNVKAGCVRHREVLFFYSRLILWH